MYMNTCIHTPSIDAFLDAILTESVPTRRHTGRLDTGHAYYTLKVFVDSGNLYVCEWGGGRGGGGGRGDALHLEVH